MSHFARRYLNKMRKEKENKDNQPLKSIRIYDRDQHTQSVLLDALKYTMDRAETVHNPMLGMYIDGLEAATTEFLLANGADIDRFLAINCDQFVNPVVEDCQYVVSAMETVVSERHGIINSTDARPDDHSMLFIWLDYCSTWLGPKTPTIADAHTEAIVRSCPREAFTNCIRFYSCRGTWLMMTVSLRGNPSNNNSNAEEIARVMADIRSIITDAGYSADIKYHVYRSMSAIIKLPLHHKTNIRSLAIGKKRDKLFATQRHRGCMMCFFYLQLR